MCWNSWNINQKNKDITGIRLGDEEYKLSQYAADTSLIWDGTPGSMDGILRELDLFKNIFGLKNNFQKKKNGMDRDNSFFEWRFPSYQMETILITLILISLVLNFNEPYINDRS